MDSLISISQLPAVPVMARSLFAQHVGVSEDTVAGWINKGYIPVIEVGKYRLINLALMNKMALEVEFSL
jgi:predicted site-specific integrase-resolvase